MTDFLARLDDYAATGALPDVEWVLRAAPHKFGLGSTSHRLSGKPCVTRSLTAVEGPANTAAAGRLRRSITSSMSD